MQKRKLGERTTPVKDSRLPLFTNTIGIGQKFPNKIGSYSKYGGKIKIKSKNIPMENS